MAHFLSSGTGTGDALSRHSACRFDGIAAEIHTWARGKGFYDRETLDGDVRNVSLPAEKLMLIVSEAGEVLEALRDGDTRHEAEEVADVLIRVLDYAAWRGINLDHEVEAKMAKNNVRPHLHGRTF